MTFRLTRLSATIVVFVLLVLPIIVSAQGIPKQIVPETCNQPGGCESICDVVKLAQNVLNFGIFVAVVISAFLFAYAGWNMITAGGNTEIYAKGKRVFGNVLIGLIIILAGYIIIDTLMKTLTGTGLSGAGICAA
jgi:hypothetical protein